MTGFVTVEMTQLALNELAKYPAAAFDAVAAEGNTTLIEKGLFKRGQKLPHLPGGWKVQVFMKGSKGPNAKPGEEAEGRVILFYGDLRTQQIWHKGQKVLATKAGLSEEQAENWVRSKVPYKHENLEQLAIVMRKPKKIEAYLKWPGGHDRDKHEEWAKEFNMRDPLTPARRNTIASLVNDLVHGVEEKKPQILSSALDAAMAKLASAQEQPAAIVVDSVAAAEKHASAVIETHGDATDESIDEAINGNVGGIAEENEYPAEAEAEPVVVEEAAADQQQPQ